MPFTLLSDEKQTVAKAYGAKRSWPFSWLFPYPCRNTLIIDPDGKICGILPDIEVSTHVHDIMDIIKKQLENFIETDFKMLKKDKLY